MAGLWELQMFLSEGCYYNQKPKSLQSFEQDWLDLQLQLNHAIQENTQHSVHVCLQWKSCSYRQICGWLEVHNADETDFFWPISPENFCLHFYKKKQKSKTRWLIFLWNLSVNKTKQKARFFGTGKEKLK